MNINFKSHFPWPGADGQPEPTNFASQIVNGMLRPELDTPKKLHTIRRIKAKPRYREGMKLVLQGGSRFKPVPFAETVCTGVQVLRLWARPAIDGGALFLQVEIPGQEVEFRSVARLAANDGLSPENFTKWFLLDVITNGPGEFELVHWTDLRY